MAAQQGSIRFSQSRQASHLFVIGYIASGLHARVSTIDRHRTSEGVEENLSDACLEDRCELSTTAKAVKKHAYIQYLPSEL